VAIWTGVDLFTVVPSPSSPETFPPVAQRVPSVFTNKVWPYPAENAFTEVAIWIGVDLLTVVPSPSCPK
jgi:hypothetical protein